ncbi:InterPro IPR000345 [uncultured Candidatus Thioglobus sp.]|nr:InterPro IPR000345 [uncultured Candidatus Thioglobus sp.]
MKNVKVLWVIIIVLSLIVVGIGYQFITGSTLTAKDGRTAIILTKAERHFVLKEMRGLLGNIQQLVSAGADNDIEKIIQVSKALVEESKGNKQVSIIAKTPLNFKALSKNIHSQFGELYEDAITKRDPQHSLKKVSIIMQNCIACHSAYQLTEEE